MGRFSSRRGGAVPAPGAAEATGRGEVNGVPLAMGRGLGAPGTIGRGRGRSSMGDRAGLGAPERPPSGALVRGAEGEAEGPAAAGEE